MIQGRMTDLMTDNMPSDLHISTIKPIVVTTKAQVSAHLPFT
jgi:hypothetical protein